MIDPQHTPYPYSRPTSWPHHKTDHADFEPGDLSEAVNQGHISLEAQLCLAGGPFLDELTNVLHLDLCILTIFIDYVVRHQKSSALCVQGPYSPFHHNLADFLQQLL